MGRDAGKPHKDGIMRAIESLADHHEAGLLNGLTFDRTYQFVTDALYQAYEEAMADMHYAHDVEARLEESTSPDYLASEDGRRELHEISEAGERAADEANHLLVAFTLCYTSKVRYATIEDPRGLPHD